MTKLDIPKKLSEKVDLEKLQELGALDIIGLTSTFNKLNKGIEDGSISVPIPTPENADKSQGKIVLDTLHKIKEIEVISPLKRFGMNVAKSLKGQTEETSLNLAANFLIIASKPSNFIEVTQYPELSKVVSGFHKSLQLMRSKGASKTNVENMPLIEDL